MGYNTQFTGSIGIEPPLTWADIKDSPFLPANARRHGTQGRDLMFMIDTTDRETPEGVLSVRCAVALVSTWEDEARGYSMVEHLQEVVDAYPTRVYYGRIDAVGEVAPDVWRLKVVNRKAVKFEPTLIWPRESE
jgi:Family of unknown function (DUF6205)